MLVKDVMSNGPVTVRQGTRAKAAIALLADHEITSLPVLDREGRVCGVVSEADLIRDLVAPDPRTHEIPSSEGWRDQPAVVADVMTPHAVTVRPETDLAVAVDLITSTSIKSVPVVDAFDHLVGMLSRSDVVRVLARSDEDLASEVASILRSVDLGDWLVEVTDGVVELTAPEGGLRQKAMAHLVAGTVAGVVEVRV